MSDKSHLHVEFYTETVENPRETAAQGRVIFDDREMVKIRIAGDKNSVLCAPAHQVRPRTGLSYAQQFPEHYKLFKEGLDQSVGGTPLSELTFLSKARVAELRALNIHNIEALAGLDGANLKRIGMGGREIVNQAKAYLERAEGNAVDAKLAAQNAVLEERNAELQRQINELAAQIGAVKIGSTEPIDTATQMGDDLYASYSEDDLKNIIKDATGRKPPGTPSRETLIATINDLKAQKEQAA